MLDEEVLSLAAAWWWCGSSMAQNTTGEFLLVKEAYETLHNLEMRIEFDRKKAVRATAPVCGQLSRRPPHCLPLCVWQVGEVAELAVNVGEILAADLAIPLARDVAIPLIKATITHIDQAVRPHPCSSWPG